jgi:transcriptional regulator of NAD metabolism
MEVFIVASIVLSISAGIIGWISLIEVHNLKVQLNKVGVSSFDQPVNGYHKRVLEKCFELGIEDVQIQPDQNGRLSLYDMDPKFNERTKGAFFTITELIEPGNERDVEKTMEIMESKIKDWLKKKEDILKETK